MIRAELVLWEDVRRDCKYPVEDVNEGFEYGINWLDENDEVIEVSWFKTDQERFDEIEKEGVEIVNP